MAWYDFLLGRGGEYKALPTMSPEQQGLYSQLFGGLSGVAGPALQYYKDLLGGGTGDYEAPAMRQFQEEIIPGIAERFTGMGAGAQGSSAFGQQLGAAGAGLAERLAMQRAGLRGEAAGGLLNMLQSAAMTPTFQWGQMPGQEGILQLLAKALGTGIGSGGGMMGTGWLAKKLGIF